GPVELVKPGEGMAVKVDDPFKLRIEALFPLERQENLRVLPATPFFWHLDGGHEPVVAATVYGDAPVERGGRRIEVRAGSASPTLARMDKTPGRVVRRWWRCHGIVVAASRRDARPDLLDRV